MQSGAKVMAGDRLNIELTARVDFPDYLRPILRKTVRTTIAGLPAARARKAFQGAQRVTLNVAIVSEKEITKLNRAGRGKARATDVLTFGVADLAGGSLPEEPERDLGDIFICWAVLCRQAKEYGETRPQELARLTAHGVLHLFGYDHEISKRAEKEMFRLQDKIIRKVCPNWKLRSK